MKAIFLIALFVCYAAATEEVKETEESAPAPSARQDRQFHYAYAQQYVPAVPYYHQAAALKSAQPFVAPIYAPYPYPMQRYPAYPGYYYQQADFPKPVPNIRSEIDVTGAVNPYAKFNGGLCYNKGTYSICV